MNIQQMKIGVAVIGVALLTYVFFPMSAKPDKRISQPEGPILNATRQEKTKVTQTHVANVAKQKQKTEKTKTRHTVEARIEPDMRLRKESEHRRHSGPPSKMYGGL